MYGDMTQSIGPLTPAILCWASLAITVAALVAGFFFTNITAFAKRLRGGKKQSTSGSTGAREIHYEA
jgi:hypothetical protein